MPISEVKAMKESFAEEIEELQEQLSNAWKQLNYLSKSAMNYLETQQKEYHKIRDNFTSLVNIEQKMLRWDCAFTL